VARVCIGFVLLLTPTGSLPSRRWRWWARLAVVAPVLYVAARALLPRPLSPPYQSVPSPFAVPALAGLLLTIRAVTGILVALAVVVAAASLVVRFRRARGAERLQLRWVVLAAALSAVAALVGLIAAVLENTVVLVWTAGAYVVMLPLAIGAAVLRYRLYDLDRIISRTLSYGRPPCCWAVATPEWCSGSANCSAAARAWPLPWRRWRWPRCSSRPAAACSGRSTGASTGAATTLP